MTKFTCYNLYEMKLIHTADWHLGQTFFEYDRREEHLQFLAWLQGQLRANNVDVLLIAGDIFDSPNPSAESQRVFYAFLRKITIENPGLQVVIIAGNHDSAARLEAPNPVLEEMGVVVRGVIRHTDQGEIDFKHLVVPLYEKGEIGAWCLAVPYLRQGDYPLADSYAAGVQSMYKQLFQEVNILPQPVIAMGHLQATGSEVSENDRSERTIIGGLECVSPDSFDRRIVYTALGHLHRAQRVSGRENVRYSGSPIPMSFAEKNNKHGVVLIELQEGEAHISSLVFDPPVKLLSIPREAKSLDEVLETIKDLPEGDILANSPYLEIKVLITEPEPSLRYRIEEALQGKSVRLARITAVTPRQEKRQEKMFTYEELKTLQPLEIALDVFRMKYGGEDMPDTMKQLLQTVIKEVEL